MSKARSKADLPNRITERGSHWQIHLERHTVRRCCFTGFCELEFSDPFGTKLAMSAPFALTENDRFRSYEATDAAALPALAALVGLEITAARAEKVGALRIDFANGVALSVAPCAYESWELLAMDGVHVIGASAGNIVIFLPP